jgi:hypothetical protein
VSDSLSFLREKEIRNAKIAVQQNAIRSKRNQQYALFGGLALLLVFSVFMFSRVRITRKQKEIIERQKGLLDLKQKEMLDSIHYASKIQNSILPSEKYIDKILRNRS